MTTDVVALGVRDLAVSLSLSERTVRRLIERGELPSRKVGARRLVLVSDRDRLLAGAGS